MNNVADIGRTIVCTIHQPSIDIFEAFDEVFFFNFFKEFKIVRVGKIVKPRSRYIFLGVLLILEIHAFVLRK